MARGEAIENKSSVLSEAGNLSDGSFDGRKAVVILQADALSAICCKALAIFYAWHVLEVNSQ